MLFEGVCPVVNVPFHADESIDYDGLNRVVDFVISKGCGSVCLFAFNSEPYKLSYHEKLAVIRHFTAQVKGRADTLIGIVENSISDCTALAVCAKEAGADGLILYPPALSTPSGMALLDYFKTIAEATDLPVMIQDNPRSTGVTMDLSFLLQAFREIDRFRYIKVECPVPIRKMRSLIEATGGKARCYSGNGGIFAIDAFLNGAVGIMPGVALCGAFQKLTDLLKSGELEQARTVFERLLPLTWYEDQSLEFYIACEKLLLKEMGIIADDTVRKPHMTLSEQERRELLILFERVKDLI